MSSFHMSEHERLVLAFLDDQRKKNPDRFRVVCAKHPTKSRRAMLKVKQKEITVGLIGLQPETGLSSYIAEKLGYYVGSSDE
jgi:hypothetical protein